MEKIKIAFLGDIMPGGVFQRYGEMISPDALEVLRSFDLRVGTLECAIGENMAFDQEKMEQKEWRNIIYAKNEAVDRLKYLEIDVVSLANNHIFDLGEEGLINTMKLLDGCGIKYFGAGLNKREASAPAVIRKKGKTIAFLGYMPFWWEAPHPAKENSPGINLLYIDQVIEDIKEAKRIYDYVFVVPHWGLEYSFFPTNREKKNATLMIEAGADGVLGGHTHQLQPLIRIKRRPVCFSLGNFAFSDFYIQPTRPIWYPNKNDDLSAVKIVYNYPEYTEEYLKRVWKRHGREGMILALTITNDYIETKRIETFLTTENKIVLKPYCFWTKFVLTILNVCVSYKGYYIVAGLYYKLYFGLAYFSKNRKA